MINRKHQDTDRRVHTGEKPFKYNIQVPTASMCIFTLSLKTLKLFLSYGRDTYIHFI